MVAVQPYKQFSIVVVRCSLHYSRSGQQTRHIQFWTIH